MAALLRGEGDGGASLELVSFPFDDALDGTPQISEVEADEACIRAVGTPDEEARRFHARGGVDDGRCSEAKPAGDLARGEPVLLPECFEDDVLADADAVRAHRLVGGATQKLRGTREQGQELAHAPSLGTR